jgi:hypothetical protein
MKRDGRAIELAPAVVRQEHGVDAHRGDLLGVVQCLHSLDDNLVRPVVDDPREVVVAHGRIEHRVHQFGDRAVPSVEARERQRLGGEEVDPPTRSRNGVEHGRRCDRRRNGEAIAPVAKSCTTDRTSTVMSNVSKPQAAARSSSAI